MTVTECTEWLENIRAYLGEDFQGPSYDLEKSIDAIDLALDIIYDLEGRGSEGERLRKLVEHFETPSRPKLNHQLDIYQCPSCGGRVRFNQGFCQKCGKKLGGGKRRGR